MYVVGRRERRYRQSPDNSGLENVYGNKEITAVNTNFLHGVHGTLSLCNRRRLAALHIKARRPPDCDQSQLSGEERAEQ